MAGFAIKALAVAALVCLVFDLAATMPTEPTKDQVLQQRESYEPEAAVDAVEQEPTTPASTGFKDKLKGFVSSVKEGASDAYDSVSKATSKLDEKRKEAVAGTKKLVTDVVDKIKKQYDSYKNGSDEKEVPRVPETVQEQVSNVAADVRAVAKDAKM